MTTGADRRPLIYAAAAMLVAAMGSSLLWGFTVDDALISARVAHHLAMGLGHRFNPQGPVVDAVTPLGWAYVLMPFAKGGPLAALDAARWIGVGCSTLSAGLVGVWVSERGTGLRGAAPLLLLALSFPFAAWSVTGMETPVVTLLATLALWPGSGGALAAGLAAAWRPELLPWALVLSVGGAVARGASPRGRVFAAIAALGPALAIAATRAVVFGNPAPLAVFAKPSDTAHGLFYAAVAVLWSGAPALCLTVAGWARVDARVRAIAVASAVHVVSLVLAGGDWMPYSRLLVPVLPGVICVASAVSSQAQPWALGLRWLLVAVPVTVLMTQKLSETRAVYASRLELVRRLAAGVDPNATVASVDVGWVGAATSGEVVDLAGVTDPEVAMLGGSHTDKHIPPGFLARRGVDVLVLQVATGPDDEEPVFVRTVEQRITQHLAPMRPEARAYLYGSGGHGPNYLVLHLKESSASSGN